MKKLIRDFLVLLILGLGILLAKGDLKLGNLLAVAGGSAFVSLIAEIIRNLVEVDIENEKLNKNIVKVFRDSVLAFIFSYIAMTMVFGLITFTQAFPYIIAAFAPTVIVATISKELRMPSSNKIVIEDEDVADGFVA